MTKAAPQNAPKNDTPESTPSAATETKKRAARADARVAPLKIARRDAQIEAVATLDDTTLTEKYYEHVARTDEAAAGGALMGVVAGFAALLLAKLFFPLTVAGTIGLVVILGGTLIGTAGLKAERLLKAAYEREIKKRQKAGRNSPAPEKRLALAQRLSEVLDKIDVAEANATAQPSAAHVQTVCALQKSAAALAAELGTEGYTHLLRARDEKRAAQGKPQP